MTPTKQAIFTSNFKQAPFPSLTVPGIFLALSIPIIAVIESGSFSNQEFQRWVFVNAGVTTIIFAFLVLCKRVWQKNNWQLVSVIKFTVFGFTLGFIKGSTTQYLVNGYIYPDRYPFDAVLARSFSGGSLGFFIVYVSLVISSYSLGLNLEAKSATTQNRELGQRILRLQGEIEILKSQDRRILIDSLSINLKNAINLEILHADPRKNWRLISDVLRRDVAEIVRSQSHDIAQFQQKKLSLSGFLEKRLPLESLNIHPRVFVAVQLTVSISLILREGRETILAMWILLLHSIIAYLILIFAREFLQSFSLIDGRVKNILIFLIPMNMTCLFAITDQILLNEFFFPLQLFAFFWQLLILLTISGVSQLIQNKVVELELSGEIMAQLVDKQRVLEKYRLQLCDELARYLHGYLIAKIFSVSAQLDELAAADNFDEYNAHLGRFMDEFNLSTFDQGGFEREIGQESLEVARARWAGMVDISYVGLEQLASLIHRTQRVELTEVCEELISNAFRHGMASSITITFSASPGGNFSIQAQDNGRGVAKGWRSGFGSNLFDLATEGKWRLIDSVGRGARVELQVKRYLPESEITATSEL